MTHPSTPDSYQGNHRNPEPAMRQFAKGALLGAGVGIGTAVIDTLSRQHENLISADHGIGVVLLAGVLGALNVGARAR